MAPATTRPRPISKEKFPSYLSSLKSAVYTDTTFASRGVPASSASSRSGIVTTLAWSPLGNLIATADSRVTRVWNPDRPNVKYSTELKLAPSTQDTAAAIGGRTPRPPPAGHVSNTERVAWNPAKEAELATISSDGILRLWDVRARGACVADLKVASDGYCLAWRPADAYHELVISTKDNMFIHVDRRAMAKLSEHKQPVQTNHFAFSNSGLELLLSQGDTHVKILDFPSFTPLHDMKGHVSSCHTVIQSPSGRWLASGGTDALVTLWSIDDFAPIHQLTDTDGPVRSVSFSFDGSYIIAGSDEGTGISVWHVETGELVHTVPTGNASPTVVAWHPTRYWIAHGGDTLGLKIVGAGG